MPQISKESVLDALRNVKDPDLKQDIVSLEFTKDIVISDDGNVSVTIELTTPACPFKERMKEQAEENLRKIPGVKAVTVHLTSRVVSALGKGAFLPEVKNVIVVGSGKGGVGKSTVTANLALALAQSGAQVGLMDGDVYGPTIPTLLGIKATQIQSSESKVLPVERYGLKTISMGFFLPGDQAAIWRGPMLDKMITQFLSDVEWGSLDYLLIDLPPGTGDVQLSVCQKLSLAGALVVSTPQEVALNIAQKAVFLFRKLGCHILGLVENMSYYQCSACGSQQHLFGKEGARKVSERYGIPFLGEIPLDPGICRSCDEGVPIVISAPKSLHARAFIEIAEKLAAQISIQNISGMTVNG